MVHISVWWAAGAVTLAAAGLASAAPSPAFPELLRQARATAPRLAEGEANVRDAQGRATQAGLRPNPSVSVEVEDFANLGGYRGSSPSQSTFLASQPLELGGKRAARTAAGRAQVRQAEAELVQARADFAYDLALAYAAAEVAQARSDLLAEDLVRAEEDLKAAGQLVDAGREAELRRVQARAAAIAARADLERARAEAAEALGRLSVLVGAPEPFTAVGPSLLTAPAQGSVKAPAADETPAVLAAQAARDAAAQRVNVERTRATPDVTVSLGARRFGGGNGTTLVGGLSAPLPLFDDNRGSVSSARAQLDAADARLRTARLEAEADWRSGLVRLAAAQTGLRAAEDGAQASEEAYRLSRIGYDAGRTPLVEVLAARRAVIEAKTRALAATTQRVQAEAALARLAGRALGE